MTTDLVGASPADRTVTAPGGGRRPRGPRVPDSQRSRTRHDRPHTGFCAAGSREATIAEAEGALSAPRKE